jgi:uncharacterized repeat protein (TIGR01451 family)
VSHFQPRPKLKLITSCRAIGLSLLGCAYLTASVNAAPINNTAQFKYDVEQQEVGGSTTSIDGRTNTIGGEINNPLLDPLGAITGCNGERLPSYEGFVASLFDTSNRLTPDNLTSLSPLTSATAVAVPINPQNTNPFALTVGNTEGRYQFFLDATKGQVNIGRTYILNITTPTRLQSTYGQGRQILLEVIPSTTPGNPRFRATPIDGQPIAFGSATNTPEFNGDQDLNTSLSIVGFPIGVCNPQAVQIIKSADRASAEPGDTVVYRLTIRNLAGTSLTNLRVEDVLPLGFRLTNNNSVIARRANGTNIPVIVSQNGGTTVFTFTGDLAVNETINVAYPTTLTVDALRGTGTNAATVIANRTDTPTVIVRDGPSLSRLQVKSGFLTHTGTIIGRVFVDKNFDGEQQPNEPGIPNAVVFLDDGNRITTDANGLFSVRGVTSGYRTGVLDLSSLPGYTLAPNLYFNERNSQSRLVKLAPSGLVRMNFGVTPTSREAK